MSVVLMDLIVGIFDISRLTPTSMVRNFPFVINVTVLTQRTIKMTKNTFRISMTFAQHLLRVRIHFALATIDAYPYVLLNLSPI